MPEVKLVFLHCNSDGVFDEKSFEIQESHFAGKKIELEKLVNFIIKNKLLDNDQDYSISYYSSSYATFVYLGSIKEACTKKGNTKESHLMFSNEEFKFGDQIFLKFRMRSIPLIDQENLDTRGKEEDNIFRRTKERKIGDVVQKVVEWRRVYNSLDENGRSYSLDEAAANVGMSKKSLDDYLLQIRNARKFGFNFNEHKEEKIGILRAFNKKNKCYWKKGKPGRKPKRKIPISQN